MEFKEFISKRQYSEKSGTIAILDDNIEMKLNEYGLYEEQMKNTKQKISEEVLKCYPIFNNNVNESIVANELYNEIKDIHFDKRIGFYKDLYVGHVLEGNYRKNGSSGGFGTWILKELLENNEIDYVIHVKKNNKSKDILFKYDVSNNIEEVLDGSKTKYYPTELSEVLNTVKEQEGRYAIVGIPSFIYSIRLLMKNNKIIKERIKYTVGLICGHQKSTKFAESMAWEVGIKPGNLLDIDFRYKIPNKPANQYGVKFTGSVNNEIKTIIKPKSELFGQNWGWGMFKPLSSDFCDDVFNETADIVLGDAWLNEYVSESGGNNIVIVRNENISRLVKNALREGRLNLTEVSKDKIFESQASHYKHTHDELEYRLYKRKSMGLWVPEKRVKPSSKIKPVRQEIQELRIKISEMSHIIYLKAVEKNNYDYFRTNMEKITDDYRILYKKLAKQKRKEILMEMNFKQIFKKIIHKFKNI